MRNNNQIYLALWSNCKLCQRSWARHWLPFRAQYSFPQGNA